MDIAFGPDRMTTEAGTPALQLPGWQDFKNMGTV